MMGVAPYLVGLPNWAPAFAGVTTEDGWIELKCGKVPEGLVIASAAKQSKAGPGRPGLLPPAFAGVAMTAEVTSTR